MGVATTIWVGGIGLVRSRLPSKGTPPHTGPRPFREHFLRLAPASAGRSRAIPHQRNQVLIQPVFGDAVAGAGAQGARAGFVALVGE